MMQLQLLFYRNESSYSNKRRSNLMEYNFFSGKEGVYEQLAELFKTIITQFTQTHYIHY